MATALCKHAFLKVPFESKSLCWNQPYFCIFLVEPAFVIIPKEACKLACGALPILLMIWHQLYNIICEGYRLQIYSWCYTKRRISEAWPTIFLLLWQWQRGVFGIMVITPSWMRKTRETVGETPETQRTRETLRTRYSGYLGFYGFLGFSGQVFRVFQTMDVFLRHVTQTWSHYTTVEQGRARGREQGRAGFSLPSRRVFLLLCGDQREGPLTMHRPL